jgi:hypothetical protein
MRRESFALFDHIGGRVGRPYTDKEVNVIWLNRQFQNLPALLRTLLLDKGLAVCGDTPPKHRVTALGTPNQVVDDTVDTVFICVPLSAATEALFGVTSRGGGGQIAFAFRRHLW